jgi:hypothetical protein
METLKDLLAALGVYFVLSVVAFMAIVYYGHMALVGEALRATGIR